MVKHTSKILQFKHRKILKLCLASSYIMHEWVKGLNLSPFSLIHFEMTQKTVTKVFTGRFYFRSFTESKVGWISSKVH